MRILWCQQHNASQSHPDIPDLCWYRERMTLINPEQAPCRMVPMRLIPDNDAETLDWCVQHNLIGEGPDHCEDGDPDLPRSDWCRMVRAFLVIPALDGETP